jgi:hypothetical protein
MMVRPDTLPGAQLVVRGIERTVEHGSVLIVEVVTNRPPAPPRLPRGVPSARRVSSLPFLACTRTVVMRTR